MSEGSARHDKKNSWTEIILKQIEKQKETTYKHEQAGRVERVPQDTY